MKNLLNGTIAVAILAFGGRSSAYEISNVEVADAEGARVIFKTQGRAEKLPHWEGVGNRVEFSFPGATLAGERTKLDVDSNHPLVQRVSLYVLEPNFVKALIVLRGTHENLKERISVSEASRGVEVLLKYPTTKSAALELLKEEEIMLQIPKEKKRVERRMGDISTRIALLSVAAFLILVSGVFFIRFLVKGKRSGGSRKYLIEQLSFCSLGPRMGVALIRVGNELILVGVTPQQITTLSSMPRLQKQYDEDSRFERDIFKETVESEFNRIHRSVKDLSS